MSKFNERYVVRDGYDPYFYQPALGKTFSELTSEEKNAISHRGRAVEKIAAVMGGL